jgi:hypothetical protein
VAGGRHADARWAALPMLCHPYVDRGQSKPRASPRTEAGRNGGPRATQPSSWRTSATIADFALCESAPVATVGACARQTSAMAADICQRADVAQRVPHGPLSRSARPP